MCGEGYMGSQLWSRDYGVRSGSVKQDAEHAGASSGFQVGVHADPPRAQPAAKRKREESFAWDSAALATDTDELSFEEVRRLLLVETFSP